MKCKDSPTLWPLFWALCFLQSSLMLIFFSQRSLLDNEKLPAERTRVLDVRRMDCTGVPPMGLWACSRVAILEMAQQFRRSPLVRRACQWSNRNAGLISLIDPRICTAQINLGHRIWHVDSHVFITTLTKSAELVAWRTWHLKTFVLKMQMNSKRIYNSKKFLILE